MTVAERAKWLADQARAREMVKASHRLHNWDVKLWNREFLLHVVPAQDRAGVERLYPGAGILPAARYCGER